MHATAQRSVATRQAGSRPAGIGRARSASAPSLLRLQATAGNAAVAQLVADGHAIPLQRTGAGAVFGDFPGLGGPAPGEQGSPTGSPAGGGADAAVIVGLKRQDGLDFGTWGGFGSRSRFGARSPISRQFGGGEDFGPRYRWKKQCTSLSLRGLFERR